MDTARPGVSIKEALGNIATANPENFRLFFRRMRKMFPEEVALACLWYISSRELDGAGQTMAYWLTLDNSNIKLLFDEGALKVDEACRAAAVLKKADPDFSIRFLKVAEQISAPAQILRAMSLVPILGDYSILISWIRKLSRHADERVRSRSVKLLCELRPNKSLIERQMLSDDPRVRASAIEALWNARSAESVELLQTAAGDVHHRVVGNALVGLYLQGDHTVLDRMIELCHSSDHLFRAAMAWSFGYIQDPRAIPQLQVLAKDPHIVVRKRALRSLLALQGDETVRKEREPAAVKPPQELVEEKKPEEPVVQPERAAPVKETRAFETPRFATLS